MNLLLRQTREEMGLTQREMAKLIGISHTSLHNYESGKRLPRLRVAYNIIDLAQSYKMFIMLEDIYPRSDST